MVFYYCLRLQDTPNGLRKPRMLLAGYRRAGVWSYRWSMVFAKRPKPCVLQG